MRVFVVGASGAIGSRLVPQLIARGHEVIGSARSPDKAERLLRLGAESVVQHFDRTFAQANRLRIEGTDNLLAAAREAGVGKFVAQSNAPVPANVARPLSASR